MWVQIKTAQGPLAGRWVVAIYIGGIASRAGVVRGPGILTGIGFICQGSSNPKCPFSYLLLNYDKMIVKIENFQENKCIWDLS